MNALSIHAVVSAAAFASAAAVTLHARADADQLTLPGQYANGVLCASGWRGDMMEEIADRRVALDSPFAAGQLA